MSLVPVNNPFGNFGVWEAGLAGVFDKLSTCTWCRVSVDRGLVFFRCYPGAHSREFDVS